MIKIQLGFLMITIVFCLLSGTAAGFEGWDASAYTLQIENDGLAGTDRDYSSGIRLSLSVPYGRRVTASPATDSGSSNHNRPAPPDGHPAKRLFSLAVGHKIFTPSDLEREDLIKDDRPYAGFAYLGLGLHNTENQRKESWELDLGVVGPRAYAEESQNNVHRLIGSEEACGWRNQLADEFAVEAIYEAKWRLFGDPGGNPGFGYDVIPHLGGRLGNVHIGLNLGVELRLGWNLPPNFGTSPTLVGRETHGAFSVARGRNGIHLFIATDGRLVLRDIFLDGNTWKQSHHVEKKPLVADLMAGIGLAYGPFRASYAGVYRTKQFETQERGQVYGVFILSYAR